MGEVAYFIRHKRSDGTVAETARMKDGSVLEKKMVRTKSGTTKGSTGYWQLSSSNGFIGTKEQLAQQVAIDKAGGAPDVDYISVKRKRGRDGVMRHVFKAGFENPRHKNNWLRGTKRFDSDACYGAPCPGDFRGQYPPEFEGLKVPE